MQNRQAVAVAAVVALAGLATACYSPDRSHEGKGDDDCWYQGFGDCPLDEYAVAACQEFVACWGPCKTPGECADCIEPLSGYQDGDLAAFDLGMCMNEFCFDDCTNQDAETCRTCTNAACADYVGLCEGRATYRDFQDGDSCYDINECVGWCGEGDEECMAACYWDGSSDGRVRFWHLLWAAMGPCEYTCGEGGSDCWRCLDRQLESGDSLDCLFEPEPETGCEGLTGVALCMCATNDASFCATM